MNKLVNVLGTCKDNIIVSDMFTKANQVINNSGYKNIVCSISGGSDSDIMLDVVEKIRNPDVNITYVWFDTGLEYSATKNHLDYLQNKYNIQINRERAIKPIPLCTKEYGQPFLSKFVSEAIGRLQGYDFDFTNDTYENHLSKYPKCKGYLKWWHNKHEVKDGYTNTMFNINHNKWLKEFLIANPPTFKISNLCCKYAKKEVSKSVINKYNADLMVTGLRKSEGGVRSRAYTNCYTVNNNGTDFYRPLFWLNNESKSYYEDRFNIVHSKCYTQYGFIRTGCVCCPYAGTNLTYQMKQTRQHEPQMYKAVTTVFRESYEYTKKYRDFVNLMENKQVGRKRLF